MWWVYVDGACFYNGKPWARAGYGVWFGNNHSLNCSGTFPGRQTNQLAEIHAAIVAIEIAIDEQMDSLKIHTDSMYLIKGATSWIDKWKNNGWMTCSGEHVVSMDKWLELDEVISRFGDQGGDLFWKYVPGHSGNFGNMQADRMARDAASSSDYSDEDDTDGGSYDEDDSDGDYYDEDDYEY